MLGGTTAGPQRGGRMLVAFSIAGVSTAHAELSAIASYPDGSNRAETRSVAPDTQTDGRLVLSDYETGARHRRATVIER